MLEQGAPALQQAARGCRVARLVCQVFHANHTPACPRALHPPPSPQLPHGCGQLSWVPALMHRGGCDVSWVLATQVSLLRWGL